MLFGVHGAKAEPSGSLARMPPTLFMPRRDVGARIRNPCCVHQTIRLSDKLSQLWLCIDRIAEIKILAPRGNPVADQVDDDRIVGDGPRPISSPSHIPVPLYRRLDSVSRNEDILYRDSQIAELLEIACHRCLHFLSGHMPPRRNQFPAWKPVRGGNSKIMLLPRLYLPVHEFPDLHRVIVFSRIVSRNLRLVRVTD